MADHKQAHAWAANGYHSHSHDCNECNISACYLELEDALDMATQGKYSDLLLRLADGVGKITAAELAVNVARGEIEIARLAAGEDCSDCDHGIRGGKPCESCGGSGWVSYKSLYEAEQNAARMDIDRTDAERMILAKALQRIIDHPVGRDDYAATWMKQVAVEAFVTTTKGER